MKIINLSFCACFLLLACTQSFSIKAPTGVPVNKDAPPGCTASLNKSNEILIYAPDIYVRQTVGPDGNLQASYDDNIFLNGLSAGLRENGFSVKVETAMNVKFDACNLFNGYAQVWLLLPCYNLQKMSPESYRALEINFKYGKPIVILQDFHYYDAASSNLNSHCNMSVLESAGTADGSTAMFGATQNPSDGRSILAGFIAAYPTTELIQKPQSTHPLAATWQAASGYWAGFNIKSDNGQLQYMCATSNTSCKGQILFMDVLSAHADQSRRMLFNQIDYKYHNTITPGILSALKQTAIYFRDGKTNNLIGSNLLAQNQVMMQSKNEAHVSNLARFTGDEYQFKKEDYARVVLLVEQAAKKGEQQVLFPELVKLLKYPKKAIVASVTGILQTFYTQKEEYVDKYIQLLKELHLRPQALLILGRSDLEKAKQALAELLSDSATPDEEINLILSGLSPEKLLDAKFRKVIAATCEKPRHQAVQNNCRGILKKQ